MNKVCHLTSVHPPYDIRIFHKQCRSLQDFGYGVTLIAPVNEAVTKDDINIIPIRLPKSRLKRLLIVNFRMFRLAYKTKAELFHFHDPELLFCGMFLRILGKKVIFDIHENVRLSFKSKQWLPNWLTPFVQFFYFVFEYFALLFFNALILAEDSYLKYYPKKKSTVVLNYPLLNKQFTKDSHLNDKLNLIYIGGVMETRGLWPMLNLANFLKQQNISFSLKIIGEVYYESDSIAIEKYIEDNALQGLVEIVGKVPFNEVAGYLSKSDIGLALLKPIPNYKESLPTKIFEYMQFGIPVITNNFTLYKKYIEAPYTGICVDYDTFEAELPQVLDFLKDKEMLKQMGENGQQMVNEKWSWKTQEVKLIELYKKLLA